MNTIPLILDTTAAFFGRFLKMRGKRGKGWFIKKVEEKNGEKNSSSNCLKSKTIYCCNFLEQKAKG